MEEVIDDRLERLQREERRRQRLAARRRTWYGWGNLHSISATAAKGPLNRSMVRQHWKLSTVAPILFAVPLLVLLIVLFANLWPHTHPAAVAHAASGTAQPKIVPAAVVPSGKLNVLLLGTDQRQGDNGFRTDVIVLVSIDIDNAQVSAVSFPRDMWVKVPTLYEMKINSVMQLGGFDAMAGMIKANFGVKPDYYVLTNFEGFTKFIDLLRGIDVQVAKPLKDDCDLPMRVNGDCSVKPGVVSMDGTEALWYVRSRKTSSDFDRLRRAQEVLEAVFKKMMTRNTITKIPQIEGILKDNIQTNFPLTKAVALMPVAEKIFGDKSRITTFAITEDQSTPMISWNGEWILLPDANAIHDVMAKAGMVK
jgi:LCP family protein required for cell wall assembly